MSTPVSTAAAFAGLVDLAAERFGGKVLSVTDDFFAEAQNMLKPGRGLFIADKFTERGKWTDGWESSRKRVPGHDWCVIQLGLPGTIRGVDADTNHFLGNHPPYISIDAAESADGPWTEILPRSPMNPGSQNLFGIASDKVWTHVRLNMYPDGGIARFRVYGDPLPAKSEGGVMDLAALGNGGRAVACSDMFFSSMTNLILPGRGINMGDGWETKRRRGPGFDWAIIALGREGRIRKLEIDTGHFFGNYPDTASVDACHAGGKPVDGLTWPQFQWKEILPRQKTEASKQHFYEKELVDIGPVTHVRLNIYPDGGVSRFRVWGE